MICATNVVDQPTKMNSTITALMNADNHANQRRNHTCDKKTSNDNQSVGKETNNRGFESKVLFNYENNHIGSTR
jgi:hypothetical protein